MNQIQTINSFNKLKNENNTYKYSEKDITLPMDE